MSYEDQLTQSAMQTKLMHGGRQKDWIQKMQFPQNQRCNKDASVYQTGQLEGQ